MLYATYQLCVYLAFVSKQRYKTFSHAVLRMPLKFVLIIFLVSSMDGERYIFVAFGYTICI